MSFSPRTLIGGPVLVGFNYLFDRDRGMPSAKPYPKVTPSKIGSTLLPFACVHCGEVKTAVIDAKTRLGYYDRDRGFSWCPSCQGRYVINDKGTELVGALPPGATHAPALVEREGKTKIAGLLSTPDGLDVLGAR